MNALAYVVAVLDNAARELECHERGVAPRTNEGLRGHGWCEASDLRAARVVAENLLDWSEHALECISASKHPNTHAELSAAIASFKGGAA